MTRRIFTMGSKMMKYVAMTMMACVLMASGCDNAEPQAPAAQQASIQPAATPAEPLTAGAGERLMIFDVPGMHCEGCQQAVYDAVATLPGVERASVSLKEYKLWVVADAGAEPTPESIAAAVKEKASYDATVVE